MDLNLNKDVWKSGEKFNSKINWGMKPVSGEADGIKITWNLKVAACQTPRRQR